MLAIYTAAIFTSSFLLFLIQPLFAKMTLPLLGGTPAVWNTCQVFFQTALLAGYLYAHAATKALNLKLQSVIHLALLLVPLLALPIAIPSGWQPPAEGNPIPALLLMLTLSVGLPFLAVSTTNPLLQRWFSQTDHPAARDPYFLYAASNIGSMLALLAYPFLVEPNFALVQQANMWSAGYLLMLVAIGGCAFCLWRRYVPTPAQAPSIAVPEAENETVTWRRRFRWIALAFIPSCTMLGVTSYITTDIASFPLLWIVPLTLYLLSFIIVFAKTQLVPHGFVVWIFPWVMVPLAVLTTFTPDLRSMMLHLFTLFVISMMCHGELARDRPSTRNLTEFYLWMSFGGNLGGIFNALIAPVVFSSIAEYPIALVLACLLMPQRKTDPNAHRWTGSDVLYPVILAAVVGLMMYFREPLIDMLSAEGPKTFMAERLKSTPEQFSRLLLFGIPALACFAFSERSLRFALGIAVLLAAAPIRRVIDGGIIYESRSFFGVHRITDFQEKDENQKVVAHYRRFLHGTTLHGQQNQMEGMECSISNYYYPTGPLGSIFADGNGPKKKTSIAVIGLGTGGLIAYAAPGRHFTVYEIDSEVKRIAEDPKLFTFLSKCSGGNYDIVLGDGRLKIAEAPDNKYDVIVLDAFSSDAVPTHLLTREALATFRSKLAPGGILAYHISNRMLDLRPVVAAVAADAGLHAYLRDESEADFNEDEKAKGKFASTVMIMAEDVANFGKMLGEKSGWVEQVSMGRRPWTDDFSDITSSIRWGSLKP